MFDAKFLISDDLEPLTVTIAQTERLTGESRSQIYNHLSNGAYEAVKSGSRVLIIYASIKQRIANLPRAKIKATAPRRSRTKQPKSGE